MSDSNNEEDADFLSDDQEEALEMLRVAVLEAGDTGLSDDFLAHVLLRMSMELAIILGATKKEFFVSASETFDEILEDNLLIHAESLAPIEE